MSKRDHRSVYQKRNDAAKALGYKNYGDQRRARAAGTPLPTDTGARPDRRSVRTMPDGSTLVSVPDAARESRSIGAAIRNARPRQRVDMTIRIKAGQGEIDWQPDEMSADEWQRRLADADGDVFDAIATLVAENYVRGGTEWTGQAIADATVRIF